MNKTISASTMRDRLLSRIQTPPKGDDWVRVLGVPGHRDLLSLIARHRPPSIGALAALAGRAQPNISRALSALVSAGLVEVVSNGRHSIPRITESGAERASELRRLDASEDLSASAGQIAALFTIEVDNTSRGMDASNDVIAGQLISWLQLSSYGERSAARTSGDLDALGRRLLENWWRILYRRDAPFRLWDFKVEDQPEASYALLVTCSGAEITLHARGANGRMLFAISNFEQLLLDELLRPLAAHHWLNGRSARPLHALLRRIEDSRSQPTERAFCRTAGALGLAPYDLDNNRAVQIRDLLQRIPEEDSRLEFSSAVLADALGEGQLWTDQQLERFRQSNALPVLVRLRTDCASDMNASISPYRQGYALARSARAVLKLAKDQSVGGTKGLSKLLGAGDGIGLSPKAPGSLRGFVSVEDAVPTIIVEDEGPGPSAFVLARGIGDFIAFGNRVSYVANLYTARQAAGRAFAAEFMAPKDAVTYLIEEEGQPITRIAEHFGVSTSVVHRQYENSFH